ncbi:MAG: DUF1559 domain-containing protein, partial [Alphaproteobacteria bacterium]
REQARRASCISNLKQMGLAVAMYSTDYDGFVPRHRMCPDLPTDPFCKGASPTAPTGPNEIWWAPYDNYSTPNATTLTAPVCRSTCNGSGPPRPTRSSA